MKHYSLLILVFIGLFLGSQTQSQTYYYVPQYPSVNYGYYNAPDYSYGGYRLSYGRSYYGNGYGYSSYYSHDYPHIQRVYNGNYTGQPQMYWGSVGYRGNNSTTYQFYR